MRAVLASFLLACLSLLLAPACSALTPGVCQPPGTGAWEDGPPKIEDVTLARWPELVGGLVVIYVNVSDPEGEEVLVMGIFLLEEEWAEGVPGEQRVHNITGTHEPERCQHCYKVEANTSGWLPGTYKVMIVATDPLGHKDTYICDRKLMLRMEFSPPPEARRWVLVGLGTLSCLLIIMAVGVVKALRAKARTRVPVPPPVVFPPPPELY